MRTDDEPISDNWLGIHATSPRDNRWEAWLNPLRRTSQAALDARAEVRRLREELATVTGQRDAARKALRALKDACDHGPVDWDTVDDLVAAALSAP